MASAPTAKAESSSLNLALTASLSASLANFRCLCRGSRNDAMNGTFLALSTSSGFSRRFSDTDTVCLYSATFLDSSGAAGRAVVAHFRERNTGSISSITIQLSSA
ncbi:hypothetical protein F7725_020713, partial [Dissostichus mawsoni]